MHRQGLCRICAARCQLVFSSTGGRAISTSVVPLDLPDAASTNDARRRHGCSSSGYIELIVGPMFSGKSTELLRRVAVLEVRHVS